MPYQRKELSSSFKVFFPSFFLPHFFLILFLSFPGYSLNLPHIYFYQVFNVFFFFSCFFFSSKIPVVKYLRLQDHNSCYNSLRTEDSKLHLGLQIQSSQAELLTMLAQGLLKNNSSDCRDYQRETGREGNTQIGKQKYLMTSESQRKWLEQNVGKQKW